MGNMGALAVPKLTVDEYLAADRIAELKSEYHEGEVFPIVAATLAHGRLAAQFIGGLVQRLKGGPCLVAASPVRVRISPTRFVYPDVMVICGAPVYTDAEADTITNPKAIVEILSPSTADYDYGAKFQFYRMLSSFEEYVLVSQNERRVEVFRRTPDKRWILSTYDGAHTSFPMDSLGLSIPLDDLYGGVIEAV